MRIMTVVGARPQFIKAAPLSRALAPGHQQILVHTGQHYDALMSDIFFSELGLPEPDYHLAIGSGGHGVQTGAMLAKLEPLLQEARPDALLVYGDTNSTLAGALAAAKLHIPVAHVEAGLRSFNRRMPEEINRVMTDHISTWCFAPTQNAVSLLAAEGITSGVHLVGDIMLDSTMAALAVAEGTSTVLQMLQVHPHDYAVATIHRAENTDDPQRLSDILTALGQLPWPVILPLHPRTKAAIAALGLAIPSAVRIVSPLGYGDMLWLCRHATKVLTDSGGLQKEAYFLGVPCVTLRDETEWVETLENGWNQVVGTDPVAISQAASSPRPTGRQAPVYGQGDTAQRIVGVLEQSLAGM
jgi:UDP-N-acetylglucosamine 2-epimerase